MDKNLLAKVKPILQQCNPENFESVRRKLMVILKPDEADILFEYFTRIEPEYIEETCKLRTWQVIPQYNDYFSVPERAIMDDIRNWD